MVWRRLIWLDRIRRTIERASVKSVLSCGTENVHYLLFVMLFRRPYPLWHDFHLSLRRRGSNRECTLAQIGNMRVVSVTRASKKSQISVNQRVLHNSDIISGSAFCAKLIMNTYGI